MVYETVSKVRAADGSLHDTAEQARKHDVERAKAKRKERVTSDLIDLVGVNLYCAESLAREWGGEPHNEDARRPTHQDIAEFILEHWPAIAAIRQHL